MHKHVNPCHRLLLVLAGALLVSACASKLPKPDVDYKQGYNFSQVKQIAFYRESGEVIGDNPMQLSDLQKGRVDDALAYALQQKGYELVDDASQADILLSWHLVTQFKTDVQTYNTPGMYGYNRYARYSCWSCGGSTEVVSRNYTDGTFIVDMIDPEIDKSVWRGSVNSRLKGEAIKDQEVANAAAVNIFKSFPPGSETP